MSEELAIKILKQVDLENCDLCCENCPKKDKNKTCIGCLNEAKEIILDNLQQKEKNNKKALEYLENIDANYWNLGHKYNVHFDELLEILDKEVN